jgi:hypothetical protein
VQSLPELLHHQEQVVSMIETEINKDNIDALPSFLQLISVLARDLGDDLYSHFHHLFGLLTSKTDAVAYSGTSGAPNPELSGKLFECMSYLIKYVSALNLCRYNTLI